jgi:hypothetical protein
MGWNGVDDRCVREAAAHKREALFIYAHVVAIGAIRAKPVEGSS